jgi:hypothetical protein
MGESGATDVDTEARTWAVIVVGSAGALERTLEHAASVSPPERTFVVVTARRPGGLQALPPGRAHVLVEPLDRGSAAAILYPLHWIHTRDPEATVVVFGDDPPSSAPGFGHQIAQAARIAERHAESLILLGLPPGVGEPERGFIVPGERIESTVDGPLFQTNRNDNGVGAYEQSKRCATIATDFRSCERLVPASSRWGLRLPTLSSKSPELIDAKNALFLRPGARVDCLDACKARPTILPKRGYRKMKRALVVVRGIETGLTLRVRSGTTGEFLMVRLPVGEYVMTVEDAGTVMTLPKVVLVELGEVTEV